jgi:quinol-cytochrome oxidoreductase complex cytochrome b subunit
MPTQNIENHAQRVPAFLAVGVTLMVTIIGCGVNLYNSIGDHQRIYSASLLLVLTICVFMTAFFARTFALKAQDRAIRAGTVADRWSPFCLRRRVPRAGPTGGG